MDAFEVIDPETGEVWECEGMVWLDNIDTLDHDLGVSDCVYQPDHLTLDGVLNRMDHSVLSSYAGIPRTKH